MGRIKSVLGDARRDSRAEWLFERIVASGSLKLREIGATRSGELAAHRLLSSADVVPCKLLVPHAERTRSACRGRCVVAVQDTSEINFDRRRRAASGLGPTGNAGIRGFFVHPVVAVDASHEAVLGVVGAQIWTRGERPSPPHRTTPFDAKESRRWLGGAELAAACLAPVATQVVVACDREGDIYSLFARRPAPVDLLVRAAQDRALAGGGRLFDVAAAWPVLGTAQLPVRRRASRERTATVTLKAGSVTLKRPGTAANRHEPHSLTLGLVEVREDAEPKEGGPPLLWSLLTTLPVDTLADAREVVRLYRLRWRIEEVFRVMKSDGLDIEDSQLETAGRLLNLAAFALLAATRTIQLVDARDGGPRPATDVIAPEQIDAAAAIGATLQGATPRQQNPHPKGSLAWLSWIAARLGGWNCYYKPPGPKTIARGLKRLLDNIDAYSLATGPPIV